LEFDVHLDHTDDAKLDDDDDDAVSYITQLFDSVLVLGYYQLTQSVHFVSKTCIVITNDKTQVWKKNRG